MCDAVINARPRDVLPSLPTESIDLTVVEADCAPISESAFKSTVGSSGRAMLFQQVYRTLRPNRFCICFASYQSLVELVQLWKKVGFAVAGPVVWPRPWAADGAYLRLAHDCAYVLAKGDPQRPSTLIDSVQAWMYTEDRVRMAEHVAGIHVPLIRSFSSFGDVVLALPSGKGHALVAAAVSGRHYIGVEPDRRGCELARSRLMQMTHFASIREGA
jgi:hypothetical protein